ncbi:MAG TPA: hypothetical protein VNN55_00785 [bacterium]|nr:hypothetical protein [bacterium]
MARQLLLLPLCAALWHCGSASEAPVSRHTSPSGRIGIAIQMIADVKADDPLNEAQIAFIRYAIVFEDSLGQPLATTTFDDVYGLEGETLDPVNLVRWMVWSPGEDFVLLPPESWMTAPGTVAVKAVNLNPKFPWSTAEVAIDNRFWIDSLRVIGDDISDCAYSVVMFDGRTGQTRLIKAGESPVGYQIEQIMDKSILIRSLPDNCADEQFRAAFVPECWKFSLELFAVTKVECRP